ncbi:MULTISPECIES: prepilin-type N-terminal cleavage/methylation domain-containing protein [Aquitalea]|uniref:prepilin-type N-terminal cleavage/methylation domain-containing protein n=1 Tax=Aquitalea TaxID=407217 RepID=UPI0023F196E0|nr:MULTISPECIES: prepilin-type N-terminal cleavage/methylation domain-containing protein [Aquitalea]
MSRLLSSKRYRSHGFTLIEMMVAMTIGLVFLLALSALFLSFRKTSQGQGGIAQMQDDQRMAMTILSQVIQSAGYFPNPASATLATALSADSSTVSGVSFSAGQVVYGVDSGVSSTPDTLYVRYQSAQNDGVVNCQGGSNASSTTATYINQLSASATTQQLTCGLNGATAVGVVGGLNPSSASICTSVGYVGISNVKFLYGFDASQSGSVTRYASAGVVTSSSAWPYVYSVKPVITQLYCFQQGVAPQSVTFSQTISLPNQ